MDFGKEFESFYKVIRIDKEKRKSLLSNKELLRTKIKNNFEKKDRTKPKFFIQGSMDTEVSTGINPLNEDYDIDDGVYLQNINRESITPETAHKWVYDAVDGHTKETKDKSKCVRVIYANNEKHVDLPIYVEEDGIYYLAIKGKGWIENNPKKISKWFQDERKAKGHDFRKAVRYLKAWKDKRENDNSNLELFGGFQLSILASDYFPDSYDNLEEMYFKLVDNINNNSWAYPSLDNPVNSSQNTLEYYSSVRIKTFKDEFKKMYTQAKDAYEETDSSKKHTKWTKVFGDRFPEPAVVLKENQSILKKIMNGFLELTHIKRPEWTENIQGTVKIVCKRSKNGRQIVNLSSNQKIDKGWQLRFQAKVSTNISSNKRKYYWQVVNSGDEAIKAECLRGGFYEGVISKGGKVREESTSYRGNHFVKCFVIQNNECVARSESFIVNII